MISSYLILIYLIATTYASALLIVQIQEIHVANQSGAY